MRKVILQIDMTVDGFIAGTDDKIDWVTADDEMNQEASDLLASADTIMLGRVAYQDFIQYWPYADTTGPSLASKITSQINHATKLVFSRTLDSVEWGSWNNARLIKDHIAEEIAQIKAQPGKNLLLYAGADIISSFMQLNLIDEYRLRIHPVVLGEGKPLFKDIDTPVKLNLVNSKPYKNGAVLMNYVPIKK